MEPGSPFGGITIPPNPQVSTPIEMDPPQYTPYRKLLNPWFAPSRAATYEPFIRSVTTALLDDVIERGEMDFISDLTSPVPALLTAKFLGLPLEDWRLYSDASHHIVAFPPDTPEFEQAVAELGAVLQRCMVTAAQRREEPLDDLISAIVTAEVDGEPLSDQRVMEICTLLIVGGNDTTTGLLAHAFAWLSRNPGERARLIADPSLIPLAVEEFLRYFSPTQGLARTVTRPTEIGGCPIPEGARVLLSFASANSDPEIFDRPDDVVIDRFPNRHAAFGLGLHRCLGSNLARLDIRIVLEEVLARIPDFQVDFDRARSYDSIGIVNGWDSMPVTFTPGPRIGSDFTL
ncbi:cytochrome P450 [Nocardia aobensis]|uniref:Cytochrome P450 n=1 Tax=Nocardia aobensis TaxID=257277 RepID=A0ABW6P9K3_9NOCA